LNRIFEISDSDAGLGEEKLEGAVREDEVEDYCWC